MVRSDGIRLAASVFRPREKGKRPVVLLLHGSTIQGRQSPLCRLLGTRLAERGYFVVAPDFAGFGTSQDPFEASNPRQALNADRDVETAIQWAMEQPGADPSRVFLLAHSGGCMFATNVAVRDSRVRALALIGPSRYVTHFLDEGRGGDYFRRVEEHWRVLHHKKLPQWYTQEALTSDARSAAGSSTILMGDIAHYLLYFMCPGHVPLLLIDGSREMSHEHVYLNYYAEQAVEPRRLIRLPNSDHYGNTFNWFGMVLYDASVERHLLEGIDSWFAGAAERTL